MVQQLGHGLEHMPGGSMPIPALQQLLAAGLVDELTPPQITANVDDYAPNTHFGSNVWRLDLNADHNITGLVGGVPDRVIVLENVSASVLTLKHDTTSRVGNRFKLPFNNDQTLDPNCAAILRWDSVLKAWLLLSLVVDYTALLLADVSLSARITALEAGSIRNIPFHVYADAVVGVTPTQWGFLDENNTLYVRVYFQIPATYVAGNDVTVKLLLFSSVTGLIDLETLYGYSTEVDESDFTQIQAFTNTNKTWTTANKHKTLTVTIAAADVHADGYYQVVVRRNTGDTPAGTVIVDGVSVRTKVT